MLKKFSLLLFTATFLCFAGQIQAQTCSGSLTVSLTGSANGLATAAPTGSASQNFCAGATVSSLTATGTAIQWYALSSGGTALATSALLTNGTHYYASQTPSGACESVGRFDVTVTVTPLSTVALSSATGTDAQTVCKNVAITNITYAVTNATGAGVTGLPTGVTGNYSGGVFTISGTPTASGTFNYTVTTTGGCSPAATATGTVTVTATPTVALSSATGTDAQTVCNNVAITNITYAVTNATGAGVTGLPTGVTGNYIGGVFTISGTPSVSGTFNYTVTTTGGCSPAATATGSVTVTATPTIALSSAAGTNTQTVCQNISITNITYSVTNATGATVTGLPTGMSGSYSGGVLTISGTTPAATVSGTFNYTVTTTGGCSPAATATGSVTVTAIPTIDLSSATGTDAQTVCNNVAITNITYAVTNATGAGVTGLPTGVTGTYSGGVFTISGTPTSSGTFNYTVTTTGGCSPAATATGTITVNPAVAAFTCTPVQDACQLSQGQIKLQVSAGTAPYTVTATSLTNANSPTLNTKTTLTPPSGDTTTDPGYTDYLFTNLPGNAEYKFKVVDSKGCTIGGTH